MRLIISPRAREQVLEIVTDIGREQPAAARRFQQQFEEHCRTLAEMPRVGAPQEHRFGVEREYRRLPIHRFTSYGIFYEVTGDIVIIESVRHGAMLRQ